MLPILGVPISAKIIEQVLVEAPIRRCVVVVRSADQDIARYLRDNPFGGAETRFVFQPEPLGMADALKKVVEQSPIESDFLLVACDNLFEPGAVAELHRTHCLSGLDGVMCLLRVGKDEIAGKSGAAYLDSGRVARIVEKPSLEEVRTDLASIPLYVFTPKLLEYLPRVKPSKRGEYELQDAIQMLIDDGGRIGYTITNWRRTITTPDDLLAINLEMLRKKAGQGGIVVPGVEIEQSVMVGEGCVLLEGSRIGPNVFVGTGSTIGRGCRLSNCVVLPGTILPDGTVGDGQLFY